MIKKVLMVILSMILVIQSSTIALADTNNKQTDYKYYEYAKELDDLNFFKGTDKGYELEKKANRIEALIIAIRLIGEEETAKSMQNQECQFEDVKDWAKGYANYGNKKKIIKGIDANNFGMYQNIASNSFITMILRVLGYSEENGDFTWETANKFAYDIGLIEEALFEEIEKDNFDRNKLVKITHNALKTNMCNNSITLGTYLMKKNAISKLEYESKKLGIANEFLKTKVVEEENVKEENDTIKEIEEEKVMTIFEKYPDDLKYITSKYGFNNEGKIQISSKTNITKSQLKAYARQRGMCEEGIDLVDDYYEICETKDLNPVILYLQFCHETGWMYKNVISQVGLNNSYHNPCGLKITIGGEEGVVTEYQKFDSWYDGISAQTDHMALYVGIKGYPKKQTMDPRHFPYLLGSIEYVDELAGTWAGDKNYHLRVYGLYLELLNFID